MKKTYSKSSRQGLPGGPNEMFEKVKGIIVSERGQWDFPGMNTLVPTDDGRITMRGVPYPVYGQDETGYGQMMYPGQEYQFPGNNVLELPMAQNGLENTSWTDYINPMNWGVTNRDDAGDFKKAFRAARIDGDDQFMWHGKRYSTKLAPASEEEKPKSNLLDLDNSLDYLVNTRGGTRDLWGRMADTIGYHESAHTMDPLKMQNSGGPGRGIFQFEAPSLITAQNRYKRIADRLKLKTDSEILNAKSALELSPEQQYTLFLINLSESQAKLKDYADNKLPLVDLWLQGHKNKEAEGDRGSFRTSVQKAKDKSIQKGYDSFKKLGGSLPRAQMLGEFNPQSFQPNPITGLYNWEKPRVKPKLSDFEPKQKVAPRSSTSVATKSDPVKAARQINAAAAEEYERNRQGVIRATNRPVSVFRPGAGDPEAVMEFMGVPGAVRFVKSPVQSLKGAGNTIVDLGLTVSPFANMNPAAGFQYAKQGTNPLTGEGSFRPQDVEGAFNTLDAAGLATIVGAGLKAPLQQGLKQTGNIAKIGLREGVDLFHPVGRNLKRIEQEGISKGLSAQAIKNRQMQEVGITSLQRKGYFPGVSEILSEYFVPYAYDNPTKRLLDIPKKIIKGDRNTKRLADLTKVILDQGKNTLSKPRYDAWRMYSGLPQKHGTFRIAETHPINHPSYTKNQLNNLEKFSLNDERKLLHQLPNEYDTFRFMYNDEDLIEAVPHLKEALKNINKLEKTGIDFPQSDFTTTNIMGGYNRRFFDNKMEYNDIWDLDLNGLKVDKYFGKPFMSHGQLEYSFEPARNAINTLLRRADILEKNINPFTKYNFDDINIKGYNNITYKDFVKSKKQLGGALPKAQKGDAYNMQRALELGYTPDEAGHYPSVDEETGMWLKSKQHPTAWMESMYGYQLNPEVYNNYNVTYNPEGYFCENQLQYVPKKFGGSLPTAGDPVLNFIQSQSPRFSKSKK